MILVLSFKKNDKLTNAKVIIDYRAYIRPFMQAPDQSSVRREVPAAVDCNEARPFWISWATSSLRVGKGDRVGQNMFIEYPNVRRQIYSAGLASGWGSDADWYFNSPSGIIISYQTVLCYLIVVIHEQ